MTNKDLLSVANQSYLAYGKALYADGMHMTMTVIRGLSVAKRKKQFQAAMYSAILDNKVCSYCESLDGLKISLDHPDYKSGDYSPPQHKNCRCVWIYIHKNEPKVKLNWDKFKKKKGPDFVTAHYHKNSQLGLLDKFKAKLSKLIKEGKARNLWAALR